MKACVRSRVRNYAMVSFSLAIISPPIMVVIPQNNAKIETKILRIYEINPYPTAFPYGNGMVLHFYQQQESSTTKTVHKVINKGLKTYV